jgi:hypothetical protein
LFRRIRFLLLGLAFALMLPTTVAPAMAASPSNPPPPPNPGITSGTITQALLQAMPAPTAQQLAIAQKVLAKYKFQGSYTLLKTAPGGTMSPMVYDSINWWGVYLHFSPDDIHQLWQAMWLGGVGAAAAILCAPLGWIAVACAVLGAGFGWLIGEIIWNHIGYYVPSCGVHISYNFGGWWSSGTCW